jgi:photosystem II stability/assembly factor-like uncharacterized protein
MSGWPRLSRLRRCFVSGLFLFLALIGIARPARANGRFPASSSVVFDPHDPKTIYVRATFGVLVTRDGGDSWRWICERAIGFSGTEDPTYVVTPKGTIVGGTFSGAAVSRDNGCTFAFAGGPRTHLFSDLAMRADGEILGVISVYKQAGDKGSLYDNRVMSSKDDAETFTSVSATLDPTLLIESLEVAASDPARLYLTAVRGEGDTRTAAFLVSVDGGMSWAEKKFDLLRGETAPFIANVDPKRADRVYVRTAGAVDAQTRLLVTDDAGKTWKKVLDSSSPLLGFALSEDGSQVFAGNREGMWIAKGESLSVSRGSSSEVQCLGVMPGLAGGLWACSTEKSGFFVGLSKNAGQTFDPKLHLEELKGPIDCPAESSVAKECTAEWPKIRRELGLPDPNEKPKVRDPGGPALKGRATRTATKSSPWRTAAGIALVGLAAYFILQRLRRGRG